MIKMQTEIDYVVKDPVKKLPEKCIIRYCATENTISKADVAGKITEDQVKSWRLCGLSDSEIKQIVAFLRS
jgi:hypothetical protein